jgi:glycosyltransferase involved in cell wall biosynthesis
LELESKPQVSVVVPAYNEAGRIEPTLKDLLFTLDLRAIEGYEMLVVMDGCSDGTPVTVTEAMNNHSNSVALVFPNRLGKGGAIIEALKQAKGDLIAFIDADGSVPSWELCRLLELTRDYDLVVGSRYQKGSVLLRGRPLTRVVLSRSFNVLTKLIFWRLSSIRDTQCGLKVFRRSLINSIGKDLLITDFTFDVNLIYSALRAGFKVKEVGITWAEKEGSKVSSGLAKQSVAMLFSLLRLRIQYSKIRETLSSGLFEKLTRPIYSWLRT